MRISIIVAASANNVIGANGGLPWHIPEDLRQFKAITMGKPMIMGRKTFASIGRALPGRRSIVLTRNEQLKIDGCDVATSPEQAIALAGDVAEIMVIGGGEIYRRMLPQTSRIYRTRVHLTIDGDTCFPELDAGTWKIVKSDEYPQGDDRPIGFTFEVLERSS